MDVAAVDAAADAVEGVVVEDVELDAGVGVEADAEMDVVEKDAVAMDAEGVVVGDAA